MRRAAAALCAASLVALAQTTVRACRPSVRPFEAWGAGKYARAGLSGAAVWPGLFEVTN